MRDFQFLFALAQFLGSYHYIVHWLIKKIWIEVCFLFDFSSKANLLAHHCFWGSWQAYSFLQTSKLGCVCWVVKEKYIMCYDISSISSMYWLSMNRERERKIKKTFLILKWLSYNLLFILKILGICIDNVFFFFSIHLQNL